ncbi:hypothetical protein C8J46_101394 [Sphingomonas sp. PP-F2F-A104-K0414]|nr:hypothetical protein C8J46_101394 [Sphingomonas sp. PP-F2F-A104-K0414]
MARGQRPLRPAGRLLCSRPKGPGTMQGLRVRGTLGAARRNDPNARGAAQLRGGALVCGRRPRLAGGRHLHRRLFGISSSFASGPGRHQLRRQRLQTPHARDSHDLQRSLTQLDWPALGFEGRSLAHLVMQSGRFFVGHRASNDVSALTSLLETIATDERTILSHPLERCMLDSFRIDAVGAPFDAKDVLKAHGYRWNSDRRFWSREVGFVDVAEETEWLDQRVYRGRGTPNVQRVTPGERFAARADR